MCENLSHQRMPNSEEKVGGRFSFSTSARDSWTASLALPLKAGTSSRADRISIYIVWAQVGHEVSDPESLFCVLGLGCENGCIDHAEGGRFVSIEWMHARTHAHACTHTSSPLTASLAGPSPFCFLTLW